MNQKSGKSVSAPCHKHAHRQLVQYTIKI